MIAAQGLGTVLRLARKLGPVIGKVVVVVGQGQNGLIATRLMSQFAAKAVIAIDPVSPRKMPQITTCTPVGSASYTLHSFLSSDATSDNHIMTHRAVQLSLPPNVLQLEYRREIAMASGKISRTLLYTNLFWTSCNLANDILACQGRLTAQHLKARQN
eukprot:COSAG02_NODE_3722_length_6323_cov_2.892031_1_plen_158_part_00